MNIPPILKNKWVWIGGGVVFLIVILMSGSKSGVSATSGSAAPSDAQVAAQRDIAIAQLNLQAQSQQASASLAASTMASQSDYAKAQLDAQMGQYAIDAQSAIQSLQVNTTRDIQLAGINQQAASDAAAINSQNQIAKWTLDQATANAEVQSNFQLQYAEAANQTQVSLAQMQAQLVANQLATSRDVTIAGMQSQIDMANINAVLQQNITYSNNSTQLGITQANNAALVQQTLSANETAAAIAASTVAGSVQAQQINASRDIAIQQSQASAQKHGQTMGLLGSIIGGVAAIFSDPIVKKNITRIGMRHDGLGIYSYDYIDDTAKAYGANSGTYYPNKLGAVMPQNRIGVMANEVAYNRPDAMGPRVFGLQTVDYSQL